MTEHEDSHDEPTHDAHRQRGRPRRTEPGAIQYEVIRLHLSGMSNEEIARRVGRSSKTIGRWLAAPDVKRVVGTSVENIAMKLWAHLGAEGEAAWAAFVQDMHGGDPRIALRARIWLFEQLLNVTPMARLIEEGLLAEDAAPPSLRPPADATESDNE